MNAGKVLYYPCWVSSTTQKSLRWGPPFARAMDAHRHGKAVVRAGEASMSFVVKFENGEKVPLAAMTFPGPARTVVVQWEALMDATDPPSL